MYDSSKANYLLKGTEYLDFIVTKSPLGPLFAPPEFQSAYSFVTNLKKNSKLESKKLGLPKKGP